MKLSIIVPAYNEASRIGRMLDAYLPYFSSRYAAGEAELIVVVNGSSDRTADIVREYASNFPMLRCLVEPAKIGKGGALIMGFRAARGDLIGFVDADGSTPPTAFQELVDGIGTAGAIIASRWTTGAHVSPQQPLKRRVASRLFNWLVRLFFGLRITDTQCGAKLMQREVLLPLLPSFGITQWAFDVDLLWQIKRAGGRIIEIPTTWHDVEGSKIMIRRAAFQMVVALVRLRLLNSPFGVLGPLYARTLGRILNPLILGKQ